MSHSVVPDTIEDITQAIHVSRKDGVRIILTLGGTGIAPRDVTPEATAPLINRHLPGIAEVIRQAGKNSTQRAVVSRGLAGVINADPQHGFLDDVVIVNLAGSPDAAEVGCSVLIPLIPHLLAQLDGGDHRDH
jgi:molybdenum cofactor synthesis domain-containing protein